MTKRLSRTLLLIVPAALALAVPALASTLHGITPLTPKAGATVPHGKATTFRMKVRGEGSVWVYVCKSKKRDKNGLICDSGMVQRAHKTSAFRYQVRQYFRDPAYWLNRPGTYYWQAHRIECETGTTDCFQESPVVKFKVG